MQQLVGFAGQRFFVAVKWVEFLSVATFGAFIVVFVRRFAADAVAAWLVLSLLLISGVLITAFVGMESWLLRAAAVRLGFATRWWVAPAAAGLSAAGSTASLVLLSTRATSASSSLAYVPAFAAWIVAVAVLGLSTAKDTLHLPAASAAARRRRSALDEVSRDFAPQDLERVTITCDADAHLVPETLLPSPKGRPLYFLASKPWHDVASFPWMLELEKNFRDILAEATALLDDEGRFGMYAYPGVNRGGWKAYSFVSQSRENLDNLQRCPKTAALLRRVPHYPHFRDAMFSLLEPRRDIPPHQDFHNVYLTCHLGLRIPRDSGIRVGGIERVWREGECLVFDSSFSHTAYNRGEANRLILLVDFLHPEVNSAELAWLRRVGLA